MSSIEDYEEITKGIQEQIKRGKTLPPIQEKALRFNEGKPQLSYILDAPNAMKGLANRFELGAKKYERNNWKKGLPTVEVIDSLLRHLTAYQNGEVKDEDGGYHVDAIVWNAVVLSEQFHKENNSG